MKLKLAGLDGSKTNFGVALMTLDTETDELFLDDFLLVKTEKSKNKQVRAASDNLLRAQKIVDAVHPALKGCLGAFVEVPSGGQDYNAVLGFGIVIGIYASLPIPVTEVSPTETKMAALGTKTASKKEMIEWAFGRFPHAPWRVRKLKGEMVPTNDNEHLADAVAIVHAGIQTPAWKQLSAVMRAA